MRMKTIVSVVSARPNFVKAAAVCRACEAIGSDKVIHRIVHTGQHYDPLFSDIFFKQLAIPLPDINLDIHGGTRDEVIVKTEQAMLSALASFKPDVVLVYGDVNGATGAAQAAKKAGIPLAHVEAGLRSFDNDMPEELNRIAIDALADILFVTEQSGVDNLKKEKRTGAIHLVGNTMIDTLLTMLPLVDREGLPPGIAGRFAVATLHRPSNVDDAAALGRNLAFLQEISDLIPIVFPVHHRTKAALERFKLHSMISPRTHIIDALGYVPFLKACKESAFILTDSGGIQEEAVLLQKKCFTMRRNTERPITILAGSNTLIDPAKEADRQQVLDYAEHPVSPTIQTPPFWDGQTGKRIVDILIDSLS